ncbi:hypothetical protein A2774_03515 [Candidatus Roizmanbacteria bacterium RIFCSPHIGHO2_01_FULL_39_12c]|uniref:Uncharacterized protein n=1 Tax=Candidatus Roizmanbacteria bacterium RIFCSPHIGHO2_01_FULL_39_12c TaxID=1802031 RepID=A0A1F7G9R9_9BACT|nr:MAG: hypothetical protein A2774_03515 [Candidatus Roizmanbacteria bacterium RIFCSPHIGHO2_01_FULL_39_12c]OGK47830.1 MAG: hypothetical protein A2963_03180 [Candidatus Roizmanbacteria bacterium RIFCSPLOWO2_01_FULL_40_13]
MKTALGHLKKEFQNHLFDYLVLLTGGIFFLIALNLFRGDRLSEFIILFIFICFYILWGIYHHIIKDGIHLKIVVEYILIAFTLMFVFKMIIMPY